MYRRDGSNRALSHLWTYRKKKLASPRQLLAILIYSAMNHLFSSRRIETACRRDVNFLYLLEGKPAPDHATISRFRSKHLASCIKDLFAQMDVLLQTLGVISLEHIFIDGTNRQRRKLAEKSVITFLARKRNDNLAKKRKSL